MAFEALYMIFNVVVLAAISSRMLSTLSVLIQSVHHESISGLSSSVSGFKSLLLL